MAESREIKIIITADGTAAISGIRNVGTEVDKLGKSGASSLAVLQRNWIGMTAAITGAYLAADQFRSSMDTAALFSKKMAEVSTIVDNTKEQMASLGEEVKKLSLDFGKSPVDEAAALYEILSAGVTDSAKAMELLTTANKLAVGGVTEVRTAVDGLTSVTAAYGAASGTTTQIADAMFVSARAGKVNIQQLALSIGDVVSIAAQARISVDELLAAVSALSLGGVTASEGFTRIRSILTALIKQEKEAVDAVNEFNASLKAQGKETIDFSIRGLAKNGLVGFMRQLREATGGNLEVMGKLFGRVEALAGAASLSGNQFAVFNDILAQMANKAGQTEIAFKKMEEDVSFRWAQMATAAHLWSIEIGIRMFKAVDAVTKALTYFTPATAAATAALLAFTIGTGGVTRALILFIDIVVAGATAVKGFTIALLTNPFAMGAAAAVGIITYAYMKFREEANKAKKAQEDYASSIKSSSLEVASSMKAFLTSELAGAEAAQKYWTERSGTLAKTRFGLDPELRAARAAMTAWNEEVARIRGQLDATTKAVNTLAAAKAAADKAAAEASKMGVATPVDSKAAAELQKKLEYAESKRNEYFAEQATESDKLILANYETWLKAEQDKMDADEKMQEYARERWKENNAEEKEDADALILANYETWLKAEQNKLSFIEGEQKAAALQRLYDVVYRGTDGMMADLADVALRTFDRMTDAITEFAMTGKANIQDFVSAAIADLMRLAVQQSIVQPLYQGAMGFLIPRAAGGPVYPGYGYLVGESGPEEFHPSVPGTIVPSGRTGGNVIVNVQNNTGTPVSVKKAVAFDAQGTVIDMVIDGIVRDVHGLRTILGGA